MSRLYFGDYWLTCKLVLWDGDSGLHYCYQEYLAQVKQLSRQAVQPFTTHYPPALDTPGKKSLYDNLGKDETLALRIDSVVRETKKENWVGNRFKEREVAKVVREATAGYKINVEKVVELVKNQREYQ